MHPQNLVAVVILVQGMRVAGKKWARKPSTSREKVPKIQGGYTMPMKKKAAKKTAKKKKK